MSKLANHAAAATAAVGSKLVIGLVLALLPVILVLGMVGALVLLVVVLAAEDGGSGAGGPLEAGQLCAAPADDDDPSGSSAPETNVPDQFQSYVSSASNQYGIPADTLAALIYRESSWNPHIGQSPAGAVGLAQFTPETWDSLVDSGVLDPEWEISDPADSIQAAAAYLAHIRDLNEPYLEETTWSFVTDDDGTVDEEALLLGMTVAGYNAGPQVLHTSYGSDMDAFLNDGNPSDPSSYVAQTKPYVEYIVGNSQGLSTAYCSVGGGQEELVETALALSWEDRVALPYSSSPHHGADEAREEYVAAATAHATRNTLDIHTAFFTDCGVFTATVIQMTADPEYVPRRTSSQESYVIDSDDWATFEVEHEGQLQPGDVLIRHNPTTDNGHTYIYTGQVASEAPEHLQRARGASLYTRPPSGHGVVLTMEGMPYIAARYVGEDD